MQISRKQYKMFQKIFPKDGFIDEEKIEIIKNTAACLGGEQKTLDAIIMALCQIKIKGELTDKVMRQLAERGVPILEILGVTGKEYDERKENMKTDFVLKTLFSAMKERYTEQGEYLRERYGE
jgi:tape measure domain-containing protein